MWYCKRGGWGSAGVFSIFETLSKHVVLVKNNLLFVKKLYWKKYSNWRKLQQINLASLILHLLNDESSHSWKKRWFQSWCGHSGIVMSNRATALHRRNRTMGMLSIYNLNEDFFIRGTIDAHKKRNECESSTLSDFPAPVFSISSYTCTMETHIWVLTLRTSIVCQMLSNLIKTLSYLKVTVHIYNCKN